MVVLLHCTRRDRRRSADRAAHPNPPQYRGDRGEQPCEVPAWVNSSNPHRTPQAHRFLNSQSCKRSAPGLGRLVQQDAGEFFQSPPWVDSSNPHRIRRAPRRCSRQSGSARASLPRVRPGAATGMLLADHPNLTGSPSHGTRVPHLYDEDIVDALLQAL